MLCRLGPAASIFAYFAGIHDALGSAASHQAFKMFAALHAARAPKHLLDDKNVPTSAADQNAFSAVSLASDFLRGGSSDPMQAVPRQG